MNDHSDWTPISNPPSTELQPDGSRESALVYLRTPTCNEEDDLICGFFVVSPDGTEKFWLDADEEELTPEFNWEWMFAG